MKAYLQKWKNEWLDDFVYQSNFALKDRNIPIIEFNGEEIESFIKNTKFEKSDILIGSVESTSEFFKSLNIKEPEYIGYPEILHKYLNRKIEKTTLGDCKKYKYPYFIKPANKVKKFTGTTVENDKQFEILHKYMYVELETEVFKSDVVDIKSEYRCFVHKNKLVGLEWYIGDYTIFPNIVIINDIIESYSKNSPIAYALDVGIDDKGQTFLLEINDFWAIGSYGFNSKIYLQMLIDRMNQIKGLI